MPKDDLEPHSIRVGWSIAQSSLQLGNFLKSSHLRILYQQLINCFELGENPFSFTFCNNGKKCTDKTFEDYGTTFEKGDSVAAYIVSVIILVN